MDTGFSVVGRVIGILEDFAPADAETREGTQREERGAELVSAAFGSILFYSIDQSIDRTGGFDVVRRSLDAPHS